MKKPKIDPELWTDSDSFNAISRENKRARRCETIAWDLKQKLGSIGALLEAQNEATEDGYPELVGIGTILLNISVELSNLSQEWCEASNNLQRVLKYGLADFPREGQLNPQPGPST